MSDIWSAGCVLYEMVMLSPPFKGSDMNGLYNTIMRGVYPALSAQFSSDLGHVIKSML